jgi:hypothetical protein
MVAAADRGHSERLCKTRRNRDAQGVDRLRAAFSPSTTRADDAQPAQDAARPGPRPDGTSARLSAERRRIVRLFAMLDDVATYTAAYTDTRLLGQSWARISEFLLHADELAGRCSGRGRCAVIRAIDRAGRAEVGTAAWWAAVRTARMVSERHFADLS